MARASLSIKYAAVIPFKAIVHYLASVGTIRVTTRLLIEVKGVR